MNLPWPVLKLFLHPGIKDKTSFDSPAKIPFFHMASNHETHLKTVNGHPKLIHRQFN